MHAVARDTEAFPKPCVYIQLDEGSVGMGAEAEEDEEEEDEESAELRLVPAQDSEGRWLPPSAPSAEQQQHNFDARRQGPGWQCHSS